MSALVYNMGDWVDARERRARSARRPRIAIRRVIVLRGHADGAWSITVWTWRAGRWTAPEHVYQGASFAAARAETFNVWKRLRLPVAWHCADGLGLRPLRFGIGELRQVWS